MGWRDDIKKANEWSSAIRNTIEGSVASPSSDIPRTPDPNLKTADPAEVAVRTRLDFSDLIIQFPTTMGHLSFPAYVQTFSDNFTPNFSPVEVFGRSDPIPVYKSTTRSISIGVMIPCYNAADSNENLKKLNQLIKNLYPGYERLDSGTLVLDSPPMVRVKFANLIASHTNPHKGLLGFITSFQSDFGIKERGVFLGQDKLLPKAIGFSITFTPLHEHTIGFDSTVATDKFLGAENFPYDVAQSRTELKLDSSVGLGAAITEDEILGG